MKYSTMMALAVCGVLAFAVTGCKYDDAAGGDDLSSGKDVQTVDDGKIGGDVTTDPGAVIDESGKSATGLKFDQDPNYVRCTDVDFAPVYFAFDASNLKDSELSKIEAVAQHLQSNPNRVVMVEGNCDERGSNEYNLTLGELRAGSVREYLLRLGIAENRVQTKSYGEEKPAVVGSGESVWSKNRRGEFAIFQHK
ncbi:MAG: OmpA family protein [Kiritimatiellae bacterium]|nr:OmpA family protein [Kiritimatiellia bacterium]